MASNVISGIAHETVADKRLVFPRQSHLTVYILDAV